MFNEKKRLSRQEIEALKSQLKRRTRDEIMLELLLYTGARPSEILAITPDSLDVDHSEVFIKGLKGSNDRSIPINAGLFSALQTLVNGNKRLFPISYQRFYQIWQMYKPSRKSPRACRHSMGTFLYEKSKDIRLTQLTLGHKSLASTLIYSDFVDGRTKMKKALRGLYD
jgi:site-specific recombinase XerD